jgi:hypothetical protein
MTKLWLAALGVAWALTSARAAYSHDCSDEASRGRFGARSLARSDADRNGEVTLAEARAVALRLLEGLDGDADGVVTAVEAQQGAVRWRERHFEQRFVALDLDRDRGLTWQEMGVLEHRFGRLDRNGDGQLTRPELKRVYFPRTARQRGAALSASFLRWDTDRDGRVTPLEARRAAERRLARGDRNRDGVLTCSDAHAGASPDLGSKR